MSQLERKQIWCAGADVTVMQQPLPYAALESTASIMRAMHELAGTHSPADAALEQPSLVARISVARRAYQIPGSVLRLVGRWIYSVGPQKCALVLGYHADTCIALCGVPTGAIDGHGI